VQCEDYFDQEEPPKRRFGWSISELHPLKAEIGDSLVAGDSLRDTGPLTIAKKHTLVRSINDVN